MFGQKLTWSTNVFLILRLEIHQTWSRVWGQLQSRHRSVSKTKVMWISIVYIYSLSALKSFSVLLSECLNWNKKKEVDRTMFVQHFHRGISQGHSVVSYRAAGFCLGLSEHDETLWQAPKIRLDFFNSLCIRFNVSEVCSQWLNWCNLHRWNVWWETSSTSVK